jgi:uncharacterized spore protein YtfJ
MCECYNLKEFMTTHTIVREVISRIAIYLNIIDMFVGGGGGGEKFWVL